MSRLHWVILAPDLLKVQFYDGTLLLHVMILYETGFTEGGL